MLIFNPQCSDTVNRLILLKYEVYIHIDVCAGSAENSRGANEIVFGVLFAMWFAVAGEL